MKHLPIAPDTVQVIYQTIETLAFCCVDLVPAAAIRSEEGPFTQSMVSINGDVIGTVLVVGNEEFTTSLVEAILGDDDGEAYDLDPAGSCLGELANILAGVFVGTATHDRHRYTFSPPATGTISPERWQTLSNDHASFCFHGVDGSFIAYAYIKVVQDLAAGS